MASILGRRFIVRCLTNTRNLNVHENVSMRLLKENGVQVPKFGVAKSTEEIAGIIKELKPKDYGVDAQEPNKEIDPYRINDLFTVEDLHKARVHFGHKETLPYEQMRPYIFGKRLGVLIFDLEHTARLLRLALNVTAEIAYRNGLILFIYNSRQSGYLVEEAAKECGEYAFCRKWKDEVFTNSHKTFGTVTRLPDLVVMFSALNMLDNSPHRAVTLAAKMLIPTVGICDTNTDPRLITYPVPGNDDSMQSIELYCHLFKTAILRGKERRNEVVEKHGIDYYNKSLEVA